MILNILFFTGAFLLAIGLLVTVHEWGHYWVARQMGVKIVRFSIGFGRPLWQRQFGDDRTEFILAAIPLGGYVKMLDEREGEVASHELSRAFNQQSLAKRAAIVVAGPLFNLLFAILAYTSMYMLGISGLKPIIAEVIPNSPAYEAGFSAHQEITAVNGQTVTRWDNISRLTLQTLMDKLPQATFTVKSKDYSPQQLIINLENISLNDAAERNFLEKLGFKPHYPSPPAIIRKLQPNSAASRDGLHPGDRIISLNSQPIHNWQEWAQTISTHPRQALVAEIQRGADILTLTLTPDDFEGKGRMGVYGPEDYNIPAEYLSTERYGPFRALLMGIENTTTMSILTLRLIWKMLSLQISADKISGPLSIAEYAGKSAQLGMVAFLSFLGLVSVSLAVLNLLPIPLLDGGHLFFYTLEFIRGKPLPEEWEYLLQKIGLTLLISLMGLALFNDLTRWFSGG